MPAEATAARRPRSQDCPRGGPHAGPGSPGAGGSGAGAPADGGPGPRPDPRARRPRRRRPAGDPPPPRHLPPGPAGPRPPGPRASGGGGGAAGGPPERREGRDLAGRRPDGVDAGRHRGPARGRAPPPRTRTRSGRPPPTRRPLARPAPGRRDPLPAPARPTQPSEPILLPKLRIRLADFPYLHCSIDQRLFTLETGCGYRYDPRRRSTHSPAFSRAGRSSPDAAGDAALYGAAAPSSGQADSRDPAPYQEKKTLPGAPAGVCGLARFAARTATKDGGLRLRVREY